MAAADVTRSRRRFWNFGAGGHGADSERRCRDRGRLGQDRALVAGAFCAISEYRGQHKFICDIYIYIYIYIYTYIYSR